MVMVDWPASSAAACGAQTARVARVIRVEALWLWVAPLDKRAGMDTLLA